MGWWSQRKVSDVRAGTSNPVTALKSSEGFEMGTTEWACWATTDEGNNLDDQGTERVSYWHRLGVMGDYLPYTGAHCAYHRYGKQAQEGWLDGHESG